MSNRGIASDKLAIEKNDFRSFYELIKFGKGYNIEIVYYISVLVIASCVLMASSYYMGLGLQAMLGKSEEAWKNAVTYIAFFILLETISFLFKWYGSLGLLKLSFSIIHGLRVRIFEKLTYLPMKYFDTQPVGRTITRATSDVQGIETLFSSSLFRIVRSGIQIVTVLCAMLILSVKLGAFVVLSSLPAIALNFYTKKFSIHWMRELKVRGAKVNSKVAENLNGLSIIKTFGLEAWSKEKLEMLLNEHLESNLKLNRLNSIIRPLTVVLSSMPSLIVLFVGGSLVLSKQMELAIFVAFFRYTDMFLNPVRILSYEIQQIQNAFSSAERINQLFREEEERNISNYSKKDLRFEGDIEFKNVSLSYDGKSSAINDLSFSIKKSEKVGVVGRTGSGKTTMVSILAGLYPISEGEVYFDGIPLSEIDKDSLRKQIGFVNQESILFRGTIRDNLLCAVSKKESYTDNDLVKMCKITGLFQMIRGRKEGLDFAVLDNGLNLSSGEKQLINFTRILLRDPSILILDEATSNTDEVTESLIHNAVEKLMNDRTSIVIAHRLSTVKNCDRIFVFDNGKIVETGSHETLIKNKDGFYTRLIFNQLES